jgi:heme exporter protein D
MAAAGIIVGQLLLVFGLGVWLRGSTKKLDSQRYLAIFAFPFFCWLPVTVTLVTLLALRLHAPPTTIAIGWLAIALAVTALWRRGRTLENRARNPLRDILTFDDASRR